MFFAGLLLFGATGCLNRGEEPNPQTEEVGNLTEEAGAIESGEGSTDMEISNTPENTEAEIKALESAHEERKNSKITEDDNETPAYEGIDDPSATEDTQN